MNLWRIEYSITKLDHIRNYIRQKKVETCLYEKEIMWYGHVQSILVGRCSKKNVVVDPTRWTKKQMREDISKAVKERGLHDTDWTD